MTIRPGDFFFYLDFLSWTRSNFIQLENHRANKYTWLNLTNFSIIFSKSKHQKKIRKLLNDFWCRGEKLLWSVAVGTWSFQNFFFWWIQRHNFGEFFSTYIRKAAIKPFSFWIFLQRLWGFLMEEFFILSTPTYFSPLLVKREKTGIEIAHWGDQTWSLTFSIIVLCKNVCVYAITSDIYYIKVIGHQKQTSYRDRWQYFWHHSVIKHSGLKS